MSPISPQSWTPQPKPLPVPLTNLPKTSPQASPQAAAQAITRQLQANPAFLKQVSEKFKSEATREAQSSGGVSSLESSFSVAEGSGREGSELGVRSAVKLQVRTEVAPRVRRANLNALSAVENLAPALGGAAGSPQLAAEVGQAAGLRGARKGGGVLGAIVAHELSFGGKEDATAEGLHRAKKPTPPAKAPAIFFNSIQQPVMLGPAPAPRRPKAAERTPESAGRKRLSDAIHETTGQVARFLQDTNVGKMLRAVDGLQDALAVKAAERLKTERFFLNF
jgi:hypothetical protein